MVVRVNKTKDYTVMSNYHLADKNLTLKAKGLLSVVLSLPDDWEYSISGLASISREKEGAITSALKELKNNGYLVITKKMPNETETGRIEYEWDFYEMPQTEKQDDKKQDLEKQGLEFQGLEFQGLENLGQLNTNISNTNISNTKDIYIKDKPQRKKFAPPTFEEVAAYCKERNNNVDPQQFFDYYSTGEWKDAKGNPVKNWKQKIITWEKENKEGRPRQKGYKRSAWVTGEEAGLVFNDNKTVDPEPSNDEDVPEDILNMFGD